LKTLKNGHARAKFDAAVTGLPLLGEIITWHAGATVHDHIGLIAALKSSGLDESVARDRKPRHAWTRAARQLQEDRVIDLVKDEGGELTFQFTRRFLEGEDVAYRKETLLTLNKDTGNVTCQMAELERLAQVEIDKALVERTPGDVTGVIQRLFEKKADLFPIRDQGGAYFVPGEHAEFVTRLEGFLTTLGGWIRRFPIPAGTVQGDKAVRESVFLGMEHAIQEYAVAVMDFGVDTRKDTLERASLRIKSARVKLEAYHHYLGEKRGELENALDLCQRKLSERVASITSAAAATDGCMVECDHCKAPNMVSEDATACTCKECGKEFPCE
jgi:hypothetical protein